MMLLPGFGKRHVVGTLGVAAVIVGAGIYALERLPAASSDRDAAHPAVQEAAVTAEGYRAAAADAVRGWQAGDAGAAAAALSKLVALRVPKEAMEAHAKLVTAAASYREALAAGDKDAVSAAAGRLRAVAASEPWLGLSL